MLFAPGFGNLVLEIAKGKEAEAQQMLGVYGQTVGHVEEKAEFVYEIGRAHV